MRKLVQKGVLKEGVKCKRLVVKITTDEHHEVKLCALQMRLSITDYVLLKLGIGVLEGVKPEFKPKPAADGHKTPEQRLEDTAACADCRKRPGKICEYHSMLE